MFTVLRRPAYAFFAVIVFFIFGILFLYFDEFVFFSPYFVTSFATSRLGYLAIDILISVLSGIVLALSIFQTRNIKSNRAKGGKVGIAGIAVAIFSGACPCYYLVPLLAFTGGAGGVLATIGILLNTYEVPIKVLSLVLLGFVTFSLERTLRAACRIK